MKRALLTAAALTVLAFPMAGPASAQATKPTVRQEAAAHPRIRAAIQELEQAIRYMDAAPHDFGGHKAAAIQSSRQAIVDLRQALAYRAEQDSKRR
jgi:hypothetical protein